MAMHAGDNVMTEPTPDDVADNADPHTALSERAPGRWASFLAVGLGVCVCVVNVVLAVRLWKALFIRASSGSLLFALIIASFALGVFLISYGVTLGRSRTTDGRGLYYTSAVVALLIGVAALALTVWAASIVDPIKPLPDTPKSCIDLYEQALPIHKASPNFRFPATEPDQRRCDINSLLKTATK